MANKADERIGTSAENRTGQSSVERHFVALLLIAGTAIAAYLPSFKVPFVYDDLAEILNNPALLDLKDIETIIKYNPARALLMITFAADLHFWKTNPFPYHVENLVIHILNALLLYAIGERLLGRSRRPLPPIAEGLRVPPGWAPAVAVSLVFAVHPLFVEAVTYIASRSSSLTTFFYLMTFGAYIGFRDAQARGAGFLRAGSWLTCSILGWILAVATKEEGVSFPAVALAYDFFLAPAPARSPGRRPMGWWLGSLPFWLLFGVLIVFRIALYDTLMPPVVVYDPRLYALTGLKVLLVYLRLLIWPSGLNIYHDYPVVQGIRESGVILAVVIHLLVLALIVLSRKKRPFLSFGLAWYYITLSPTTSIIPLKEPMAEHRMYLAALGPLFVLGWGLAELRERVRVPPLVVGMGMAAILGIVTYRYNLLWQDEVALWKRAVTLSPHSGDAYYALGGVLLRRHRLDEAEAAYLRAIDNYKDRGVVGSRIKFSYVDALINLGLVYAQRGDLDRAIPYFRRALQENPRYAKAWVNLGFAQMQKGNYLEASFSIEEALMIDDENWLAHYHLGTIYYEHLVDPEKAALHYRRALEINPRIPGADTIRMRLVELGL